MGKKAIHESQKAPVLTKYEEDRLKKLASNRERLLEAGFKTCLANKAIFNHKFNVYEKNVEQNSDCSDYELEPNKESDCDEDHLFIPKKSSCVKSATMGDFVKRRSKEKHVTMVQQNKVMEVPQKNLQKASTCQVPDGKEKKKLGMQKKPQKVLPGSAALYLQMRKKQHLEKNNIGEKEKFYNEEPFDQNATQQDFEHEQENGVHTDPRSPLLQISPNMNLMEDRCTDESLTIQGEVHQNREISTTKKVNKTRGPTVLAEVHNRKFEDHPPIVLNEYGQPIGPTMEDCKELSRFLGTVAKDSILAPLNYYDWSKFPSRLKEKIWNYVLEKYMIPKEDLDWVMTTVNTLWRVHKSRVKAKYYYAFDTDDGRWENRPKTMSDQQFSDLLQYWNLEEIEGESMTNRSNRQMHDDPHTLGPTSMACLRYELQQQDPNKQLPSLAQVYKQSRKRTAGKEYLTSSDKANENIKKMTELQAKRQSGEESTKDPYDEVMGKDKHKGYLPLYGRGVTKSKIQKIDKKSRYVLPEEFLKDIKANLTQEVAQNVASLVLSQIKAANPDINLVIPAFGAATGNDSYDPNGEQVQNSSKSRSEPQGSNVHANEENERLS